MQTFLLLLLAAIVVQTTVAVQWTRSQQPLHAIMAGWLRTITEARQLDFVSRDELRTVQLWKGAIIGVQGNICYRLQWQCPSGQTNPGMRLTKFGLTGYARIEETVAQDGLRVCGGGDLQAAPVKVHFCAYCPCRAKFDGYEAEPPEFHLRPLGLAEASVFADLKGLWRNVPPLSIVPLTLELNMHQAARLRDLEAEASQASRLQADQAQLTATRDKKLEEAMLKLCKQWRELGRSVGIMAFFAWAHMVGRKVIMHMAEEPVDVVQVLGPWAIDFVSQTSRSRVDGVALACIVERVPAEQTDSGAGGENVRQIRLSRPEERGLINHYVPLIARPAVLECCPMHKPCDGTLCGNNKGDPCYALLCAQCAPWGKAPLHVMSDGNCAFDCMLVWGGETRGHAAVKRIRHDLADHLDKHRNEEAWREAFIKAGEFQGEGPQGEVPSRSRGELTSRSRTPEPKKNKDVCCHLTPDKLKLPGKLSPELHAALSWKIGLRRPPSYLVQMAAARLSPTVQESIQEEYRLALNDMQNALASKTTPKENTQILRRHYNAVRIGKRLEDGKIVVEFFRACGYTINKALPRCAWRRFAAAYWPNGQMTKQQQMYHLRAMRAYLQAPQRYEGVNKSRYRAFGNGRLYKIPAIREQLFKWFVWTRRHVKARLPLRKLMLEATRLRDNYMLECLKQGRKAEPPEIDYAWARRWRIEYSVSLRKPNTRWKVPRRIMKDRMRIMWTNLIRVQALIWLTFGHFADVDGFDQKPLHVHESGSKNLKTLEHRGAVEVVVKEAHAATRSRYTVVTYVTSNRTRAQALCPLEICFKGGVRVKAALAEFLQELKKEEPGIDRWLSLTATESASYKHADVKDYFKHALEAWTPTRSRGNDWRILYCDAYSAHDFHDLRKNAWERGYVLMYHGGGTTGTGQVFLHPAPSSSSATSSSSLSTYDRNNQTC